MKQKRLAHQASSLSVLSDVSLDKQEGAETSEAASSCLGEDSEAVSGRELSGQLSGQLSIASDASDGANALAVYADVGNFEDAAGVVRHDDSQLDEYARMAPLHNRLTQGRLATLAKSLKPPDSPELPRAAGLARLQGSEHHKPGTITPRDEITMPMPSLPVGRAAALAASSLGGKGDTPRQARKNVRQKVRRGSLPYQMIAAHLEGDLALPPRSRGADSIDAEDEVHVPIGVSKNSLDAMPPMEAIGEAKDDLEEASFQAIRSRSIGAD